MAMCSVPRGTLARVANVITFQPPRPPAGGRVRWRPGAGPGVGPGGRDGGGVPTSRSTRSREKPEQIADELRAMIVSGQLHEGESLGREPDLVERFGVSRPSLREALRILEAEGLITVVRGVLGGVVAHQPDVSVTARTAAVLLQSRNVTLGDVHDARKIGRASCRERVCSCG